MPFARVIPLALLAALARAEDAPLPAIFAPRPLAESALAESPSLHRSSPLSPRLASLISEQVLAKARAFDASSLPVSSFTDDRSAVLMEKFVVNAEKVRPIELPDPVSPVMQFLRTGQLFRQIGGLPIASDLRLLPVRPAGALPKEDVMRVELAFRMTW